MVQQCFLLLKSIKKKILFFFFTFINCNRIIKIMEHQKMLNLLNEAKYKFVIRK